MAEANQRHQEGEAIEQQAILKCIIASSCAGRLILLRGLFLVCFSNNSFFIFSRK